MVLACVIRGTGYFDEERSSRIGNGSLSLYEDGDQCVIAADKEPVENIRHPTCRDMITRHPAAAG